jgi:hypothetical protein
LVDDLGASFTSGEMAGISDVLAMLGDYHINMVGKRALRLTVSPFMLKAWNRDEIIEAYLGMMRQMYSYVPSAKWVLALLRSDRFLWFDDFSSG